MSKPKIICPKCRKLALDKRQYKDGSAMYVHEQKTSLTPFGQANEITKYCDVKQIASKRITVSTSKPATKLIDYAKRLTDNERSLLRWRIRDGERLIVFNVAANGSVTLVEPVSVEMVSA